MARDGSGAPGSRRSRRPEAKLEWLERTSGVTPADPAAEAGEETSLFAPVPAAPPEAGPAAVRSAPTGAAPTGGEGPPMTRREARAREQALAAEQTRRSKEQQALSKRRAAEQARGEETGVIRPVTRTGTRDGGGFVPAQPPPPPVSGPLSARTAERPPAAPSPATSGRSAAPPSAAPPSAAPPSAAPPSTAPPSTAPSSAARDYAAPTAEPEEAPEPTPHPPASFTTLAVLTVAAIVLLAWSAAAFVPATLPGVHLLAALSPLVTVIALPVIAFSAGRRIIISGVIAGIAAIMPWTLAAGYAAAGPGPTSATGGARSIRLMYIDAASAQADPASVTAAAREHAADVVVMTGLSDALTHDLAVAGLNRLVTPRWVSIPQGGTDGIGVWSRQGTATMNLVPGTTLPTGQGLLTTPAGTVDLIVAQLPGTVAAPGSGWKGQLDLLGRLPAGARDRILVGDLNATPWHASFRAFTGDTWHDAADVVGRGLRPTWPSWSPLPIAPTDHVLLSAGLGASAADTVRINGSPHRAMIATVVGPGGSAG